MAPRRPPLSRVDLNVSASDRQLSQDQNRDATGEPLQKRRKLALHAPQPTLSVLAASYHDGPSTRAQSRSKKEEVTQHCPEPIRSKPKNAQAASRVTNVLPRPSSRPTSAAITRSKRLERKSSSRPTNPQKPAKLRKRAKDVATAVSSAANDVPPGVGPFPGPSIAESIIPGRPPSPIKSMKGTPQTHSNGTTSGPASMQHSQGNPSIDVDNSLSPATVGASSSGAESKAPTATRQNVVDAVVMTVPAAASELEHTPASSALPSQDQPDDQSNLDPPTVAPASLAHLSGQRLRTRRLASRILNRDELIAALRKARNNSTFLPKDWQVEACYRILAGWDGIVAAGTGTGKSLIWLLATLASTKSTFLVITPLKAIQSEQVRNLRNLGMRAVALNENTLRAAAPRTMIGRVRHKRGRPARRDVLADIVRGKVRVVFSSPETLLRNLRVSKLIYTSVWAKSLAGIFVDEAHVVYDWGRHQMKGRGKETAPFRPEYGKLGLVRARFGSNIPVLALSATLPSSTLREVFHALEFGRLPFFALDVGVEREATSYEVESLHHPARSFLDLAQLFDRNASSSSELPQTLVYVNSRKEATDAAAAIKRMLPPRFQSAITSITALSSDQHKRTVLKVKFPCGKVRILVATEAVGMGVDLPSVDMVIQWRLPKDFKSLVQHFGRGARRAGQTTRAILLMDKGQLGELRQQEELRRLEELRAVERLKQVEQVSKDESSSPNATAAPSTGLTPRSTPNSAPRTASMPQPPPNASSPVCSEEKNDPLLRSWVTSEACHRQALRSMLKLDFDLLRYLLGTKTTVTNTEKIGQSPVSSPNLPNDAPLVYFWEQTHSQNSPSTSTYCCRPCGLQLDSMRRWEVTASEPRQTPRLSRTPLYPEVTELRTSLGKVLCDWRKTVFQSSSLKSFMGAYVVMENAPLYDLVDQATRILARHMYTHHIDKTYVGELLGPASGVDPDVFASLADVLLQWATENSTQPIADALTPTGHLPLRRRAALAKTGLSHTPTVASNISLATN
ncbi:hypothetical protein CF319_g7966 [Tilletia indica]|nr:hypothetical protein CF319_g7966 [Tilletia indica]